MRPLPLPPARTPDNGALQRQALQAGRRRAAIRLLTTGRHIPRVSPRPRTQPASAQAAGFSLPALTQGSPPVSQSEARAVRWRPQPPNASASHPLLGALVGLGLLLLLDHRLASAHLFGEVKVVGRNRPKPVG